MEAKRRGKSVSHMGAKFVELIGSQPDSEKGMPPTTALLLGILKIKEIFKDDYKLHLRVKCL